MKNVVCLCLLLFSFCHSVGWSASTPWKTNAEGQVCLVSAEDRVSETGPLLLGLHFKTTPGWYVYWKYPGDSGYPPKFDFGESRGLKNVRILWPSPTRFNLPGHIVEYGYEGEVVYPVVADLAAEGAVVHAAVAVSYLTCNTSCIPYKYTLALDLPVDTPLPDGHRRELIDRFVARVPPTRNSDREIERTAPQVTKVPVTLPLANAPAGLSTAVLLLLAFFGGVILNVMPCVLPVLSIKLLGVIQQAQNDRSVVVTNSLISAAGIVTSFLLLAFITILAQQGGRAVGWGIQFQNPPFVAFLGVILILFAMNLWGVFEMPLPSLFGRFATTYGQGESPVTHFMSGFFATVLATPCSAPFLGTAIGFSLTQPPPVIFATFGAVGVGMALPYFLLALFPGHVKWLPKPGVWMVRIKVFFGMVLLGTAVWLFWVFLQQVRPVLKEPFEEKNIQSLLEAGKPVLVDVGADWCVTCKYNEKFVLASSEVKEALRDRGVVLMRADWTSRDETIQQYLAKFGRSGVPFYAYYHPGRDPVLLSEFLTKRQVLETLK